LSISNQSFASFFLLKKYSLDKNFSLANKIKVLAWPFWMQCNTLIIVGLLVEKD